MGADLYINSIHTKSKAKYEALFNDAVTVREASLRRTKPRERLACLTRISDFLKSDDGRNHVARMKEEYKDDPVRRDLDYINVARQLRTMMPLPDKEFQKGSIDIIPTGYQGTAQLLVNLFYEGMYMDGYYRDAYNGTCLLARINLSWWNNIVPLLRGGFMPLSKVKWFRNEVAKRPLALPTVKELKELNCKCAGAGEKKLWHNYYKMKRQALIDFLDLCLKLKEQPYMSL